MMTKRWLPSLITGTEATGHVLADIQVTDRMDASNHMDNEGNASPQPDDQTHLVSRGAACEECEETTQSGNGVKIMFLVVTLFVPYFIQKATIFA